MSRGPQIKVEGSKEILTHPEVLQLLSEQAKKGSVSSAVALERALRHAGQEHAIDEELDRILNDK